MVGSVLTEVAKSQQIKRFACHSKDLDVRDAGKVIKRLKMITLAAVLGRLKEV